MRVSDVMGARFFRHMRNYCKQIARNERGLKRERSVAQWSNELPVPTGRGKKRASCLRSFVSGTNKRLNKKNFFARNCFVFSDTFEHFLFFRCFHSTVFLQIMRVSSALFECGRIFMLVGRKRKKFIKIISSSEFIDIFSFLFRFVSNHLFDVEMPGEKLSICTQYRMLTRAIRERRPTYS